MELVSLTRRSFLTALAGAPLAFGAFWEKRPFTEWSAEEIDTMLTDSPWAKPVTSRFELSDPRRRNGFSLSDSSLLPGAGIQGIPGLGTGGQTGGYPGGRRPGSGGTYGGGVNTGPGANVPAEAYLTLRWSSALPIKQALMADRFGPRAATDPEALRILSREEPDYVVEIFGVPSMIAHQGPERLERDVAATAELIRKGGRPLRPGTVKIPAYGQYLSVSMRFPRTEPITLDEMQVEFFAEAGPMVIRKKFKLRNMVHNGRLEL